MSEQDETQEVELTLREKEDVEALQLEMDHLKGLVSFGQSEAGKVLVAERERQVINQVNKLFTYLTNPVEQHQIISTIAQLKVAVRDLVDFKGSQSSLEDRKILLDTLLKKK